MASAYFQQMMAVLAAGGAYLRQQFVLSAGRSIVGVTTSGYLTGYTRYNARRRMDVKGGALVNPVAWFPSFVIKASGYVAAPNAFTLSAAIEYNGTSYPLTFGGNPTVSMSSSNWFAADPVAGLTIPNGATAYCRVELTVGSTSDVVPAGEFAYPGSYAVEQVVLGGTSSQVSATGPMTSGASGGGAVAGFANEFPYSAAALSGAQPSASSKSILGIGMSITDGMVQSYDTSPDAAGNVGWFAKGAYAAGVPFTKMTRGSNQARWCVPSYAGDAYTALMAYHTHVVLDCFTNDLAIAGRSLAQMQSDCTALVTAARDARCKVAVSKILIRTNTSNVPVTGFAVGGVRDQFNAWLDTKLADGTIDYVLDFNPDVESAVTPNTWDVYADDTYDGVHPRPARFTDMASRFQSWCAAL